MIGFMLVMILGGHLLTDLNPRLGARVDVIPLATNKHPDGGIWLGIYLVDQTVNVVTSDRYRLAAVAVKLSQIGGAVSSKVVNTSLQATQRTFLASGSAAAGIVKGSESIKNSSHQLYNSVKLWAMQNPGKATIVSENAVDFVDNLGIKNFTTNTAPTTPAGFLSAFVSNYNNFKENISEIWDNFGK